jgi:DNA repair exonuclease SbcCD ATPase subunit
MHNELRSSILRIGLVNSGMFDLLDLNLDVRAIHYIAGNNVGKTSLIELIQFLYFHNLSEMTFSKSTPETQQFYFRREGSYILFEVRTVKRLVRTIGIYGEGTSDSRKIFVFDGSFALADFMDEKQVVQPLKKVQVKLFARNFATFQRNEDYERALIGTHSEGKLNVQLFELKLKEFRLLRRLLQGLLRLDKLTAREAQAFLISIVEAENVATSINLAIAFESRYNDIQKMRFQLDDLRHLKPIIEKWHKLTAELQTAQHKEQEAAENYYHTYVRHLDYLKKRKSEGEANESQLESRKTSFDSKKTTLIQENARITVELKQLRKTRQKIYALQKECADYNQHQLEQEGEKYQRQILRLKDLLAQISADDLNNLQRRQRQLENEQQNINRLLNNRTVWNTLQKIGPSEETLILIKHLLSEQLISLPESAVADQSALLSFVEQTAAHVQPNGSFTGFGLHLNRDAWFTPLSEEEPLEERLAHVQNDLEQVKAQIEVAHNRQKQVSLLQDLESKRNRNQTKLKSLDSLDDLYRDQGSLSKIDEKIAEMQDLLNVDRQNLTQLEIEVAKIDQELRQVSNSLSRITDDIRDLGQQNISQVDTPCPVRVQAILEIDLAEEFRLGGRRLTDATREIRKLQDDLMEPNAELEKRYDRADSDAPFADWLEKKLDISGEISRLELLLHQYYDDLITQVKRQLSNLTTAFEAVKNQIAALNNAIRKVSISNIEQIQINIDESEALQGIRDTSSNLPQIGLFDIRPSQSRQESEKAVQDFLDEIRNQYGQEVSLAKLFSLRFQILFSGATKPEIKTEIDRFESNGTRIAIKIVLFLGLIRLLQPEKTRKVGTRIPFFLDEVGSLDSKNLKALINYCETNNFLPIFASPDIREEIPHNYIFRRTGKRSQLVQELIIADSPDPDQGEVDATELGK